MNIRILLPALLAAGICAADPVRLELQTFEQPLASTGWRFYAWSRSLDSIAAAVVADGDGKVVRIEAVDTGAAGLSSKSWPIAPADTAWRVSLRIKASADYAGNAPWLFVAASGADGFLPPAVSLAPAVKATAEWTTATVTVQRTQLPAGAQRLAINLASAAAKDGKPAGGLYLDDVTIEALR